jgi:hypothetical protein
MSTFSYTYFGTGTVTGTSEELIGGGANELVVHFTNRGSDVIWLGINGAAVGDYSGSGAYAPVLPGETAPPIVLPNDTNSPSSNSNLYGITEGADVHYSVQIDHVVVA